MTKIKIFSRYSLPPSVDIDTGSESIVDQNAAYEADINNIIKRYQSLDELELEAVTKARPMYGDSTLPYTVADIFQMKNGLVQTYSSLPDSVKSKFKDYNDFVTSIGTMSDTSLQGFFTDVKTAKAELEILRNPSVVDIPQTTQGSVTNSQPVVDAVQNNSALN